MKTLELRREDKMKHAKEDEKKRIEMRMMREKIGGKESERVVPGRFSLKSSICFQVLLVTMWHLWCVCVCTVVQGYKTLSIASASLGTK